MTPSGVLIGRNYHKCPDLLTFDHMVSLQSLNPCSWISLNLLSPSPLSHLNQKLPLSIFQVDFWIRKIYSNDTVWTARYRISNEKRPWIRRNSVHLRFKDRTSCPIPRGSDCILDVSDPIFLFWLLKTAWNVSLVILTMRLKSCWSFIPTNGSLEKRRIYCLFICLYLSSITLRPADSFPSKSKKTEVIACFQVDGNELRKKN